mgnify:CR=1 FL=1
MDVSKRAKVLIQAMPYIKKYSGETIVVKYGGNAMINEELKAAVMSDLVLMQLVGVNVEWQSLVVVRYGRRTRNQCNAQSRWQGK